MKKWKEEKGDRYGERFARSGDYMDAEEKGMGIKRGQCDSCLRCTGRLENKVDCSHLIGFFHFQVFKVTIKKQPRALLFKQEDKRSYLIFRNAAMPNTNTTTAITAIVMAAMLPAEER